VLPQTRSTVLSLVMLPEDTAKPRRFITSADATLQLEWILGITVQSSCRLGLLLSNCYEEGSQLEPLYLANNSSVAGVSANFSAS